MLQTNRSLLSPFQGRDGSHEVPTTHWGQHGYTRRPRAECRIATYTAATSVCLLAADAAPVFIPPLIRKSDLTPILDHVDGVMLTGGDDLDPRKMGLSPHPSVTLVPSARAGRSPALQGGSNNARMPVLGIGLGMPS